jgi:hypothetical protein
MTEASPHPEAQPDVGQPEPMIDGIPEAYFRAYVGKNADVYLAKFRIFHEHFEKNHLPFRERRKYYKELSLLCTVVAFICGLPLYFLYRKMYAISLCWLVFAVLFQIVERTFPNPWVWYSVITIINIVMLDNVIKYYYFQSKRKILITMNKYKDRNKCIEQLQIIGGVNIIASTLFFLISIPLGYYGLIFPSFFMVGPG